jgi:hypothetical protein
VVFLVMALFFLVLFPFAVAQRRLRHREEMTDRIPVLKAVVAEMEASRAELGRIPADESEFDERVTVDWAKLGCCPIINYTRVDSSRYTLHYGALDVDYRYDSAEPQRGWQPTDAATER